MRVYKVRISMEPIYKTIYVPEKEFNSKDEQFDEMTKAEDYAVRHLNLADILNTTFRGECIDSDIYPDNNLTICL